MSSVSESPAALAAAKAQARVEECIDAGKNFRLEAGAGAGKTFSLVKALKRLVAKRGREMIQRGQQVACITFTEVAKLEIAQEIESHPAILVETIHAFCWGFMGQFQPALRQLVEGLEDRQAKIEEGGGVGKKRIEYSLGFFGVDDDKVSLSHDDVPKFMASLLQSSKFRDLLAQRFPVIFIDEYQDTDRHFMAALNEHFFETNSGPLIGLFGDHWQTIYRNDFSLADFANVQAIDKGSNFRSAPAIVNVLNKIRPELPQEFYDSTLVGEARFFHANNYDGPRTNDRNSKGDVPDEIARSLSAQLRERLANDGWDFAPAKTKILMLTHNALAAEQGYPTVAEVFDRNEAFAKKEDPSVAFFADILEPMVEAYNGRRYGDMFRLLGSSPTIRSHKDKAAWLTDIHRLGELRLGGSIGDVLDHLKATKRPRLPDKVMRREEDLQRAGAEEVEGEEKAISRQRRLRNIPYKEVVELTKFLNGSTPFATQHSVKGAQFENVLVILGGGWNHYNWPHLFELLETKNLNAKNEKGFFRARNLFYVAISRPKTRLAVLATQTIEGSGLAALERLFGANNIVQLSNGVGGS